MAESSINVNSFNLLNQAMNLLLPYFDSPIIVEYPIASGKTVNLYNYLNLLANTLYNQIKILPENKSLNLKLGFIKGGHLKVKIVDIKNNPLSNVPIACYVDEKTDIIRTFSDSEGHGLFPIPKINNEKIQIVYYFIDVDCLFHDSHFFTDIVLNRAQTKLNIIFPKIHLQIIEKHLGFEAENPFIEPVLMKFFNQKMRATFVKDEPSDLIVKGQVNTNKISDDPITLYGTNIYQVTADFNITILDSKTTNQIISKSFNIQKEIDYFSFDEASNNALKKISSQIQNEFLPELGEIILNN